MYNVYNSEPVLTSNKLHTISNLQEKNLVYTQITKPKIIFLCSLSRQVLPTCTEHCASLLPKERKDAVAHNFWVPYWTKKSANWTTQCMSSVYSLLSREQVC